MRIICVVFDLYGLWNEVMNENVLHGVRFVQAVDWSDGMRIICVVFDLYRLWNEVMKWEWIVLCLICTCCGTE